jgi:hypothetical protein
MALPADVVDGLTTIGSAWLNPILAEQYNWTVDKNGGGRTLSNVKVQPLAAARAQDALLVGTSGAATKYGFSIGADPGTDPLTITRRHPTNGDHTVAELTYQGQLRLPYIDQAGLDGFHVLSLDRVYATINDWLGIKFGDNSGNGIAAINAVAWAGGEGCVDIHAQTGAGSGINNLVARFTGKGAVNFPRQPYGHLRRSVAKSIANAAWTTIDWDIEDQDIGEMHAPSAGTLVAPATGAYIITACVCFAPNGTGNRYARILYNAASVIAQDNRAAVIGDVTSIAVVTLAYLDVGSTVEFNIYQNSGGPLDMRAEESSLSMAKIA